ncbi:nicotinamide N-methyltransferase-like [Mixophyes fleayi]|uniref:nicotinamide N-methyltransferase-like n=1 Tax=Mixophyes fleayi TaxID=3061075 RepID=UPI003F4DA414
MDSTCHKFYHVDGFDSRGFLDTYFSDKPEMVFGEDTLKSPLEKLHHIFKAGHIKGETVIDISIGPIVHHLYSVCEFFKHIYLLRFTDKCVMELNRWLNTRTGAFQWNHTSTYVTALEGNSDQCEDKEMRLKTAIKMIVKCDIKKENLTDSVVLPQADCVISAGMLDVISKDQADYIRNLRKIAMLIKPGGHLILVGALNATYLTAGPDRFHLLKYDENDIRKVVTGEGFIIDHCDVVKRKAVSDLSDYEAVIVLTAHREK